MTTTTLPAPEAQRLQSLAQHHLLDTQPEDEYDDITRLAAELCGTPMAAINLIAEDRQWSKSAYGFEGRSMPLLHSLCVHTILTPEEPMVVPDMHYDERFFNNPLSMIDPALRFYAGVPVKDAEGLPLGSLCVLDRRPRELPDYKLEMLKALAKLVNTHFQLRRTRLELDKTLAGVEAAQTILQALNNTKGAITSTAGADKAAELHAFQHGVRALKTVLSDATAVSKKF